MASNFRILHSKFCHMLQGNDELLVSLAISLFSAGVIDKKSKIAIIKKKGFEGADQLLDRVREYLEVGEDMIGRLDTVLKLFEAEDSLKHLTKKLKEQPLESRRNDPPQHSQTISRLSPVPAADLIPEIYPSQFQTNSSPSNLPVKVSNSSEKPLSYQTGLSNAPFKPGNDSFHSNADLLSSEDTRQNPSRTLSTSSLMSHEFVECPDSLVTEVGKLSVKYNRMIAEIVEHLVKCVQKQEIELNVLARTMNMSLGIKHTPLEENQSVDELFHPITQQLNCFNPNIALLFGVDESFCENRFQAKIIEYSTSLKKFMTSSTIKSFETAIKKAGIREKNVKCLRSSECRVITKVNPIYKGRAANLIVQLKELMFEECASAMSLDDVHQSVLTITYTMPSCCILPVLAKVLKKRELLKIAGIISVQVGMFLLPIGDNRKGKNNLSDQQFTPGFPEKDSPREYIAELHQRDKAIMRKNAQIAELLQRLNILLQKKQMAGNKEELEPAKQEEEESSPPLELPDHINPKHAAITDKMVLEEVLKEKESVENQLEIHKEIAKKAMMELEQEKSEGERKKAEIDILQKTLEERDCKLEAASAERERMNTQMKMLQEDLIDVKTQLLEVEDVNAVKKSGMLEEERMKAEIDRLQTALEKKEEKLEDASTEREKMSAQIEMLQKDLIDLNSQLEMEKIDKIKTVEELENKLQEQAMKIKQLNTNLNSELLIAASTGKKEEVVRFIVYGAKTDCSDKDQRTPLHFASKGGYSEVVTELLSRGAAPTVYDRLKKTPLHFGSEHGHIEVVKSLVSYDAEIDSINTDRKTSLHLAAAGGHTEIVKFLLAKGASRNMCDRWQKVPLHYASEKGHLEIVTSLLSNDAKIDIKDRNNSAAIHLASGGGHTEIVEVLLAHNAEFNIRDDWHPPLNWALLGGHTEAAKSLVSHGASITSRDEWSCSPILIATVLNNEEAIDHFISSGVISKDAVQVARQKYQLSPDWKASRHKHQIKYTNVITGLETEFHPKMQKKDTK